MTLEQSLPSKACPQCGAAIVRIPRRPEDRVASETAAIRRYRCGADGCGWEGTLAATWADTVVERRRRREAARLRARQPMSGGRALFWVAVGLACVALGAGGVKLYRTFGPASLLAKSARVIPFGVNDYGKPLSENHPFMKRSVDIPPHALQPVMMTASIPAESASQVAPQPTTPAAPPPAAAPTPPAVAATAGTADGGLTMREDCAWGNPGRNPYQGSVEQALKGAKLPPDVARLLEDKIRAKEVTDQLEIRNDKIRAVSSDAAFEPRAIKMTFGRSMCLNTRVNFKPGHVERADLYEVADARGMTYSVMVPYVCGNVSVLGARAERDARPQDVLASTAERQGGGSSSLANVSGQPSVTGQAGAVAVPEPETLALLTSGLALLGWFTRRRRRDDARG